MNSLSAYTKKHWDVVIIGGGATGIGTLRDLSMRGVKALLLEQKDLAYGTSSRFHGLLHSGARYVVTDQTVAHDCAKENLILRNIAQQCIEKTEGLFIRTHEDDPAFEQSWINGCKDCGIMATPIDCDQIIRDEPALSQHIVSAYQVNDASIDGFKLVWHNAASAQAYGGTFLTYTQVTDIITSNGIITGLHVKNTQTQETAQLSCSFIINATGGWGGTITKKLGLDLNIRLNKGTLIVFNHRITQTIINRLRKPSDGDILVPHETTSILGTTSQDTNNPEDFTPTQEEVLSLLDTGKILFPYAYQYRILRAFTGIRPLYLKKEGSKGAPSRGIYIVNHEEEGIKGIASIWGGKLSTYRLMAEHISDVACKYLGNTAPCRTDKEHIIQNNTIDTKKKIFSYFPSQGIELITQRHGESISAITEAIEKAPWKAMLLCECEMITYAEFEYVASKSSSYTLSDICSQTRIGMGTCQGTYCGLRMVGALIQSKIPSHAEPLDLLQQFQQKRWRGIVPTLWGDSLREAMLSREIYCSTLNIDGKDYE